MARQRRRAVLEKFEPQKGFVTEYSETNFPQGAVVDIQNCVIHRKGSIYRRGGFNQEVNALVNQVNGSYLTASEASAFAFNVGNWQSAGNSANTDFSVVQAGSIVQLYYKAAPVSANLQHEIDLADYAVGTSDINNMPVSFAEGMGRLFIVGKYINPLMVSYNANTNSVSVTEINIRVRDFELLQVGLLLLTIADDERPSIIVFSHEYNLRNAGWQWVAECFADGDGNNAVITDPVRNMFDRQGVYPALSDRLEFFRTTTANDAKHVDAFNFFSIAQVLRNNTINGGGHFIHDAFNIRRWNVMNAEALREGTTPITSSPGDSYDIVFSSRPEHVAFHNGRVFYTSATELSTGAWVQGIYFSQQLISFDRVGRCYQQADPTAEEINDLVATDGGYIPTPEIGDFIKMVEFFNGVLIFSSKGLFLLTGDGDGVGFTATSHRIIKLSDIPAMGKDSIVLAESAVFYFSRNGIIQVSYSPVEGTNIQNITRPTIQKFYNALPTDSKVAARGQYIKSYNRIYWTYPLSPTGTLGVGHNYMLVLDLELGFYKFTVTQAAGFPEIFGIDESAGSISTTVTEDVTTISGETVTTVGGEDVVTFVQQIVSQNELPLFFTLQNDGAGWGITASVSCRNSFRDWITYDNNGVSYVSYVDFAHMYMGDRYTAAQPIHIHSYFVKHGNTVQDCTAGGAATTTAGELACQGTLSIVLLLDVSDSVISSGFLATDIIPAVKSMVSSMIAAIPNVEIAIDVFSSATAHVQDFTNNETTLLAAVDTAYGGIIPNNNTNLSAGLDLSTTTLASATYNLRATFVVTDGVVNEPADRAEEAAFNSATTLKGISDLYVAGMLGRDGYNDLFLATFICTQPATDFYVEVLDYPSVDTVLATLATCPKTTTPYDDYYETTYASTWKIADFAFDVSVAGGMEYISSLGLYIAGVESLDTTDSSMIYTSTDGLTWTRRSIGENTGYIAAFAFSPTLGTSGRLVAVGDTSYSDGVNDILYSDDGGVTWNKATSPSSRTYRGVVWSATESLFIAVSGSGAAFGDIVSSSDGISWTARMTGKGWAAVTYADTLGLFVATGFLHDDVAYSSDGITWNQSLAQLSNRVWDSITWSASVGKLVASTNSNAETQGLAYSSDGITWTRVASPGGSNYGRASTKWVGAVNKYISVSPDNSEAIISSTDGINWSTEYLKTDFGPYSSMRSFAVKDASNVILMMEDGLVNYYSIAAPF